MEEITVTYSCDKCKAPVTEKNKCIVCSKDVCVHCSSDIVIQEVTGSIVAKNFMYLPCCEKCLTTVKQALQHMVSSFSNSDSVEDDIKKLRTEQLKMTTDLEQTKAKLEQLEEDNEVLRSLMVWKNRTIKELEEEGKDEV